MIRHSVSRNAQNSKRVLHHRVFPPVMWLQDNRFIEEVEKYLRGETFRPRT